MFSSENETKRMILANNCLDFHEYTTFDHSSGFTELYVFCHINQTETANGQLGNEPVA